MRTYIGLHWVITRKKVIRHNRVLNVKFDTDWKISWIVKFEMGVVGRGKSNADWCNAALSKKPFFVFLSIYVFFYEAHTKHSNWRFVTVTKGNMKLVLSTNPLGHTNFSQYWLYLSFVFPLIVLQVVILMDVVSAKTLT